MEAKVRGRESRNESECVEFFTGQYGGWNGMPDGGRSEPIRSGKIRSIVARRGTDHLTIKRPCPQRSPSEP